MVSVISTLNLSERLTEYLLMHSGAQSEVDYTEQLNFSDDDEQGSSQKEKESG